MIATTTTAIGTWTWHAYDGTADSSGADALAHDPANCVELLAELPKPQPVELLDPDELKRLRSRAGSLDGAAWRAQLHARELHVQAPSEPPARRTPTQRSTATGCRNWRRPR